MKKLGCAKCGGSMKKMAKGGLTKPFIAGITNGGPTGPNYQGIDTMKKGGGIKKKYQKGGGIEDPKDPKKSVATQSPTKTLASMPRSEYRDLKKGARREAKLNRIQSGAQSERVDNIVRGVASTAEAAARITQAAADLKKQKRGGTVKKYAKGGSTFGMLSVKAGVDNNPKPTAADRIAGAKKKAKFGASVPVQHSPAPGRVRSSSGVGTVPVGARKKMGGSIRKKK